MSLLQALFLPVNIWDAYHLEFHRAYRQQLMILLCQAAMHVDDLSDKQAYGKYYLELGGKKSSFTIEIGGNFPGSMMPGFFPITS